MTMIYEHKKRKSRYKIICFAKLQLHAYNSLEENVDMTDMVVYQDIREGHIWVRTKEEFFDGRFEEIVND